MSDSDQISHERRILEYLFSPFAEIASGAMMER
jgi:hypothetical protein